MKAKEWAENLGIYGGKDSPDAPLRLLLYGEPGAGKTYFALTAPKPFVIDTDRGLQTAKTMGIEVPYIGLSKTDQVFRITKDILVSLRDGTAPFDEDPPETLIIDSIMALSEFILWEFMLNPDNPRVTRKDPLREKAEYDHWAALQNRMRELLDITKDLKQHVVATAGEKVDKDEMRGNAIYQPSMAGGIRNVIGHYFDEMFFMQPSGSGEMIKYMTYTRRYMDHPAKSRTGRPAKIEDASFGDLTKKRKDAQSTE